MLKLSTMTTNHDNNIINCMTTWQLSGEIGQLHGWYGGILTGHLSQPRLPVTCRGWVSLCENISPLWSKIFQSYGRETAAWILHATEMFKMTYRRILISWTVINTEMWNGDFSACDICDWTMPGDEHKHLGENIRHWTASRLSGILGQIRGNDRSIKNKPSSYHWHQ